MKILINSLGIQDSGGITVLDKMLLECIDSKYNYLIICNRNENILNIMSKYKKVKNFEFRLIKNKGFLHRLYFENIIFRNIIKEKNIDLVYNFSGSAQFFSKVPQITKIQNLLFYSKKIDEVYFQKKEYVKWLKQIFLKRIVFHTLIKQTSNIEVQSNHVKEYMGDFIDVSKKKFFIKSDIAIDEKTFESPKQYDFTKKLRFLYIVGPHFEYLHKNFQDFVNGMKLLKENGLNFELVITLTKEQLHNSNLWDNDLDDLTKFLGYTSKEKLKKEFQDNTILISTSVIETIGLHVIEAIQNGILAIAPNEKYSLDVYGSDILTYKLFDAQSLVQTLKNISLMDDNQINDIMKSNQQYLIENERLKLKTVIDVFDIILREIDV